MRKYEMILAKILVVVLIVFFMGCTGALLKTWAALNQARRQPFILKICRQS